MHLQRRLRCQHDARAARDVNRLPYGVTPENACAGANENQIRRVVDLEAGADPQRRLGIRVRDHRPGAATFEAQLQPRFTADRGRCAIIA